MTNQRNHLPLDFCLGMALLPLVIRRPNHVCVYELLGGTMWWSGFRNLDERARSGSSDRSQDPAWRYARNYMRYLCGQRRTEPQPSDIRRLKRNGSSYGQLVSAQQAAQLRLICHRIRQLGAAAPFADEFYLSPGSLRIMRSAAMLNLRQDIARAQQRLEEADSQLWAERLARYQQALAQMETAGENWQPQPHPDESLYELAA